MIVFIVCKAQIWMLCEETPLAMISTVPLTCVQSGKDSQPGSEAGNSSVPFRGGGGGGGGGSSSLIQEVSKNSPSRSPFLSLESHSHPTPLFYNEKGFTFLTRCSHLT